MCGLDAVQWIACLDGREVEERDHPLDAMLGVWSASGARVAMASMSEERADKCPRCVITLIVYELKIPRGSSQMRKRPN